MRKIFNSPHPTITRPSFAKKRPNFRGRGQIGRYGKRCLFPVSPTRNWWMVVCTRARARGSNQHHCARTCVRLRAKMTGLSGPCWNLRQRRDTSSIPLCACARVRYLWHFVFAAPRMKPPLPPFFFYPTPSFNLPGGNPRPARQWMGEPKGSAMESTQNSHF